MGKTIPMRCNACGNLVGSARVVEENEEGLFVDGDMKLEQHKPDCPVFKVFQDEDMKFYSISFGPYEGPLIEGETDGSTEDL